jgi:4'-phosphopantetheinyl transferase EntD
MVQTSGKSRVLSEYGTMNPATLSGELAGLFLPGVAAAVLRAPGDVELLLPAETLHIGRAVPRRAREFAAGRLCARRAMAEFGIVGFALEAAADRQPIWPDSMVGSITHTADFCAAVAAPRRIASALGLDSEVVGDVKADLLPSICVADEMAWLAALPPSERAAAAALVFSAKEAFYKLQYPAVGERLGFHDVSVTVPQWAGPRGVFQINATRSIAMSRRAPLPFSGRYLFHEQFVTAGMALAAGAPAQ